MATYQDILDAPPNKVAELLAGELHLSPRPPSLAALAKSRIIRALDRLDEGPRPDHPDGWLFLSEPELHLGPDVLVPDLVGWRRERMPELPDTPALTLAPDWVCEVASPSTQRADRLLKMPIYLRAGVPWLWIVDPLTELVEVYQGDGARWVVAATAVGAGAVRLPPFDALELDPGRWFAR